MELIIKGAEDLERIGKALKLIGGTQLKRELSAKIREATKPAQEDIRAAALQVLPKRGGLADLIAASKLTTRVRYSGRRVGVQLTARNRHDIYSLDKGRVRHPLYGNRDHWFQQQVTPGWFTTPMFVLGQQVRIEVSGAMEDFIKKHLN